jgi:hypothetical protein
MRNVPAGTGSWLGWANAVITELVPAAAGIEIRRRKRQHRPVTYPMTILIADAVISIAVQLSDAIHTLAGGLAFALPALAFLALTKLVLSRARTAPAQEEPKQPQAQASPQNPADAPSSTTTGTTPPDGTESPSAATAPPAVQSPAAPVLARDRLYELTPVPPAQLLASARMTAFAYRQETGDPITAEQLSARLGVPSVLAESLLDRIGGTPPPVTTVNGTVVNGSRP